MYHPSRGGVRGGRDQFSWDDVKVDKHRENYLGHNLKAPVERWQKVSCSFPPMCLPSMLTPPMATLGIRDATKKSLVQCNPFSLVISLSAPIGIIVLTLQFHPVDNVKAQNYPAILVTAGLNDMTYVGLVSRCHQTEDNLRCNRWSSPILVKKGQRQCATCGGRHLTEKFRGSGACFRCGEIGQMKRDCPQGSGGSASGSGSHHSVRQRSHG
ncbi:uncharacterized protein [Henckelia pumila]|uniref:uncharacterized protein isoform X2 n=1 Tax=Henckelia pumila TaxID=405737 RepID=UPI003C6DFBA6